MFNNSNTFILKEIMVRKIILDLFVITVKVIDLFYKVTLFFPGITSLSMLKFYDVLLEKRVLLLLRQERS